MDWQVGDEALCIKRGKWKLLCGPGRRNSGPEFGKTYRVRALDLDPIFTGGVGLFFSGFSATYSAIHFIKTNGPEADAFDREVIEALKSEPVHAPQHAALHNGCQCEVLTCADAEQLGSAG